MRCWCKPTHCLRDVLFHHSVFARLLLEQVHLCDAGPGKVPVHYFGTQEFAWMKSKDVVSFELGLQRGMHICKASNRSRAAFQRALHEVSLYFLVCASLAPRLLLLAAAFRIPSS